MHNKLLELKRNKERNKIIIILNSVIIYCINCSNYYYIEFQNSIKSKRLHLRKKKYGQQSNLNSIKYSNFFIENLQLKKRTGQWTRITLQIKKKVDQQFPQQKFNQP